MVAQIHCSLGFVKTILTLWTILCKLILKILFKFGFEKCFIFEKKGFNSFLVCFFYFNWYWSSTSWIEYSIVQRNKDLEQIDEKRGTRCQHATWRVNWASYCQVWTNWWWWVEQLFCWSGKSLKLQKRQWQYQSKNIRAWPTHWNVTHSMPPTPYSLSLSQCHKS